jgi:hypothetical protein
MNNIIKSFLYLVGILLSAPTLMAKSHTDTPIDSIQYLIQQMFDAPLGDSTIHPLRILGERVTNPYTQQNNSGILNKSEQELKDAAMALVTAIPSTIAADFKVFDYTAYSLIGRMKDPEKWNEWAFGAMDSLIRTKYNTQYYLLIAKEIDPSNGKVKFRIKLSVPTVVEQVTGGTNGLWDNLTEEKVERMQNAVLEVIAKEKKKSTNELIDEKPKIEGIKALTKESLLVSQGVDLIEVGVWSNAISRDRATTYTQGLTPRFDAIYKINTEIDEKRQIWVPVINSLVPYTIIGFRMYDNSNGKPELLWEFSWNPLTQQYEALIGQNILPLLLETKNSVSKTKIYKSSGNKCFAYYIELPWNQDPLHSLNSISAIENEIATKNLTWCAVPFFNPPSDCYLINLQEGNKCLECGTERTTDLEAAAINLWATNWYTYGIAEYVNKTCLDKIVALSLSAKLNLIRKLAFESLLESDQYERAILRLISSLKTNEYVTFISALKESNHKLLNKLIVGVDDATLGIFQNDSYTQFMYSLIKIYNELPDAHLENLNSDLTCEDLDKTERATFSLVPDHYRDDYKIMFVGSLFSSYKSKYGEYVPKNEKIYVKDEYYYTIGNSKWPRLGTQYQFNNQTEYFPLTPVFLTSTNAELPLVQTALIGAPEQTDKPIIIPAIFLDYVRRKRSNDETEKAIITTLDGLTIATGGGAAGSLLSKFLLNSAKLKKAVALTEVAAAANDILINTSAIDPKSDIAKYSNIINASIGLLNAPDAIITLGSGLKKAYGSVKRISPKIKELINSGGDIKNAKIVEPNDPLRKDLDITFSETLDEFNNAVNRRYPNGNIPDDITALQKVYNIFNLAVKDWSKNIAKYITSKNWHVISDAGTGALDIKLSATAQDVIARITPDKIKILGQNSPHFEMADLADLGSDFTQLDRKIKQIEIDGVIYAMEDGAIGIVNGKIRCAGNGTYCFAQDTPLPDGSLMSEKQEGDFITAYDTEKKTTTQAKISKIRRSFTSTFTRLWIAGSMLSVTPAHALQTEAGEWRAAGQLQAGDYLRSAKGVVRLDSTYTESVSPTAVISYELEGGEAYVVGEMPIVVAGICQLRSVVEAFDGNKVAFQNLIRGLNPSQRSALIEGIAEITDLTKRKDFIKAFVADANFSQGIVADASLIKTWSGVKFLNAVKNDATFLKWLGKLKKSNLGKHLKGEINAQNQAVGCHLQSAVDNVRVKIINPPAPTYNGSELVRAKIEIDGVVKSKFSDFFPSSWDETRVFEEAALILKNPANQLPNNVRIFKGTASDGITKIQVELTGADSNNLQINTVFPY